MDGSTPRLEGIQQVSSGWINKYILNYTLPDGTPHPYECASRKDLATYQADLEARAQGKPTTYDAISVVARTNDHKIVLIKEFRYALNSWCIALPAGLIDHNETLEESVNRELQEEIGYTLRTELGKAACVPLPQAGLTSAGFTDESVRLVFAQVKPHGCAQPDQGELIEPFLLALSDAGSFLARNTLPIDTRAQLVLNAFSHQMRPHDAQQKRD